jgi:hypothetical protein
MDMPRRSRGLSRRSVLAKLGVAAAASPFVPLLNASGQETTAPLRLILFFTPHGTIDSAWRPTGTETSFTVGPILTPLRPFIDKKKVVVLSGLDMIRGSGPGAAHTLGPALLWTGSGLMPGDFQRADCSGGCTFGWNIGPSVDQVIARRIGGKTSYASLELGVSSGSGSHTGSRTIYAGPAQPRTPQVNPFTLAANLFTGANKAYAQLSAERRSTIDLLEPELDALRTKIGSDDREKLESHLGAIRALEKRLSAKADGVGGPALGPAVNPSSTANVPVVTDAQMQIMARAAASDLTRVMSLQFRVGENDTMSYPWLGVSELHHHISHAGDADVVAREKMVKIYTWYATMFGKLLGYLDAIPEGNGTVLDNSIVVWGSELGKGNTHDFRRTPFVFAGGAGGKVKGGRYLELPRGTSHSRLLVSLCHLMGLGDVQTFGKNDNGTGPLARL